MRRWSPAALLGIAVVGVLVLGAAANGFERSLDRAPESGRPQQPTRRISPPRGRPLRASVVALFFDRVDGSSAVVARVTNPDARRSIVDAPITIELVNHAGSVIGTNATAGPIYTHVPYLAAGASVLFVSDGLQPSQTPAAARVRAFGDPSDEKRMQLLPRARRPRKGAFGWVVDVSLADTRRLSPQRVYAQAVVRRSGRIVAAGTEIVRLPRRSFQIFLIGDPRGGVVVVWASAR